MIQWASRQAPSSAHNQPHLLAQRLPQTRKACEEGGVGSSTPKVQAPQSGQAGHVALVPVSLVVPQDVRNVLQLSKQLQQKGGQGQKCTNDTGLRTHPSTRYVTIAGADGGWELGAGARDQGGYMGAPQCNR